MISPRISKARELNSYCQNMRILTYKNKAEILLWCVTRLWQLYYIIKALSRFDISKCSGQNGRGIPSRKYDIILLKNLFIQYYLLFISLLGA